MNPILKPNLVNCSIDGNDTRDVSETAANASIVLKKKKFAKPEQCPILI